MGSVLGQIVVFAAQEGDNDHFDRQLVSGTFRAQACCGLKGFFLLLLSLLAVSYVRRICDITPLPQPHALTAVNHNYDIIKTP